MHLRTKVFGINNYSIKIVYVAFIFLIRRAEGGGERRDDGDDSDDETIGEKPQK